MSNLPSSFCIDIKAEKEHPRLKDFKDWFKSQEERSYYTFALQYYGMADGVLSNNDKQFGELLTLDRFFELLDPKQEKIYTISDLSNGVCAVENDGTADELNNVLVAAIPKAKANGTSLFYYVEDGNVWSTNYQVDLLIQSVKLFLQQLETPEPKEEAKGSISKDDVSESDNGLRYNDGKLRWSLVDFQSLEDLVKVLGFGASKYSDHNWKKGLKTTEIFESMMRHMTAYISGEDNDQESGLSHIGHIMCNAMFLSYMQREKPEFDNRILKQIKKNK